MRKLTIDERIAAYRMLLEGHTTQEIANKFGCTRQNIYRLFPGSNSKLKQAVSSCVYPNVSAWMLENKCGYSGLDARAGLTGNTAGRLFTGGDVKKSSIDKLLGVLGMTYEEAFSRR